ncbi:unnamed protein product [Pieris macdunnoughi]|uniref:Uncharacterized protein n=1 Tax=Pieris macdunnoughi TaxID=345717 RepID=A0A821XGP9_9NEOP|nr:unnamed protein product [Pieris macdunnoughi]
MTKYLFTRYDVPELGTNISTEHVVVYGACTKLIKGTDSSIHAGISRLPRNKGLVFSLLWQHQRKSRAVSGILIIKGKTKEVFDLPEQLGTKTESQPAMESKTLFSGLQIPKGSRYQNSLPKNRSSNSVHLEEM